MLNKNYSLKVKIKIRMENTKLGSFWNETASHLLSLLSKAPVNGAIPLGLGRRQTTSKTEGCREIRSRACALRALTEGCVRAGPELLCVR